MLDEHVIFFEAVLIEQDGEALAGGQAALLMLRRNPRLPSAQLGAAAAFFEFLDHGRH
jgi:hypothetical protein